MRVNVVRRTLKSKANTLQEKSLAKDVKFCLLLEKEVTCETLVPLLQKKFEYHKTNLQWLRKAAGRCRIAGGTGGAPRYGPRHEGRTITPLFWISHDQFRCSTVSRTFLSNGHQTFASFGMYFRMGVTP